jgi:hypothetical protein
MLLYEDMGLDWHDGNVILLMFSKGNYNVKKKNMSRIEGLNSRCQAIVKAGFVV